MQQHVNDRFHYLALFFGQLLIRASCSFFVAMIFVTPETILPRNDHHRQDTVETGERGSREFVSVEKSFVDEELGNLIKEVEGTTDHNAPGLSSSEGKEKYAQLCSVYSMHCLSTIWEGSYDWPQKYLYQGLSIVLMQQIDKRLSTNQNIQNTLSELKIYQSNEDRRGSAGHTNVKINSKKIPTSREYREVLTHELGHIVDLGVLQGSSDTKNRSFTEFGKVVRAKDDPSIRFYQLSRISESSRKADASYKDFVSGYAMKGIYEDFAETKNLWFNHNLLFQEITKDNTTLAKKYTFFKNLYSNKWFDGNPKDVTLAQTIKRSRDTTKIQ